MKNKSRWSTKQRGTFFALASLVIVGTFSSRAFAQGPLPTFVENNGGSEQLLAVATAIQTICPALVNIAFNGLDDALAAPESAEKDITLRCNELVQTSVDLNTGTTLTPRGLRIDNNGLLSALQQVNGEEITAKGTVATRASNSQFSNIGARLGALKFGALTSGGIGVASNFSNQDGLGTSMPTLTAASLLPVRGGGAAADDNLTFGRWGTFVNGSFNSGKRDSTVLENQFDFDAVSVTAGVDYNFGSSVLGVSIGYDDYESDFADNMMVSGGSVSADGYTASIFGLMDRGSFYLTGIASHGKLDYTIDRTLEYASMNMDPLCQCPNQLRSILATPDGEHTSVGIDLGFDILKGYWSFSPHLGISYRDIGIDGYVEDPSNVNDGMNLRYDDQSIESLRTVLGIQISGNMNSGIGSLRPTLRLDWHHEFEDAARQIQVKYSAEDMLAGTGPFVEGFGPGCLSCFSILTDIPEEDFFVAGLGLSIMFQNAVQGFIFYEGLVGYEDLTSNAISLGLRAQF